jgi:hypothetical protein
MKKRININKKSKDWKARYPLVEIHWLDILSDPSWQSLKGVMQMELPQPTPLAESPQNLQRIHCP